MSEKRWTYGGNGSHWDGCAEVHWDCKIAQLEAENAASQERIEDLELRLDVYNGNMYDVVVLENERLRSELAALREQVRWIPVSERLPEDYESVLIFTGAIITYGFHNSNIPQWAGDGIFYHSDWYNQVTHWMPLPQPPEGE